MQADSLLRRISAGIALAVVAALLLAAVAGGASRTVQLGGKWSGHYSGAVSGSFTLTWTQRRGVLSGSITLSNPRGTYHIGGGVVGSAIHFGAVGVGATYTGTASSTSMSGTWNSPEGGGSWSAKKVKKKVTKKKS